MSFKKENKEVRQIAEVEEMEIKVMFPAYTDPKMGYRLAGPMRVGFKGLTLVFLNQMATILASIIQVVVAHMTPEAGEALSKDFSNLWKQVEEVYKYMQAEKEVEAGAKDLEKKLSEVLPLSAKQKIDKNKTRCNHKKGRK